MVPACVLVELDETPYTTKMCNHLHFPLIFSAFDSVALNFPSCSLFFLAEQENNYALNFSGMLTALVTFDIPRTCSCFLKTNNPFHSSTGRKSNTLN